MVRPRAVLLLADAGRSENFYICGNWPAVTGKPPAWRAHSHCRAVTQTECLIFCSSAGTAGCLVYVPHQGSIVFSISEGEEFFSEF